MAEKEASGTATGVALLRAIEAQRPAALRICNDQYAHALIPGGLAYFLSRMVVVSGLYEQMAPGAMAFVVGRERYIDDLLKARLAGGVGQVVILGAGFDTRAYRIPGIERARVFEIDAPATQKVKRQRLERVIRPLPAHVAFLAMDLNTQALALPLDAAGYNAQARTLFIWQGVTYFLTAEAVDNTLDFIAHRSGPDSEVVFDYFYNEILQDTRRRDVKLMRRAARATGEEYLFGIGRGQVGAFLTRRGFRNVHDLPLEELKSLYFTGPNARRTMATGISIVSARVAPGRP